MEKTSRHEDEPEYELPGVPMGADGAPLDMGSPPPVPERTAENMICLRGPCVHYWHMTTMSQAGNPAGTWEHLGIPEPKQHHHVCLRNPGFETDFADDNCYDCNQWDPVDLVQLESLERRRANYHELHQKDQSDD